METENIRLTQYSHGAGCGCKISPQVLEEILAGGFTMPDSRNLLVGNNTKDDAAVYDLQNGQALISTTDFFMPIVDDPFIFGKIAAANSISDVYAMGGRPLMAIAILGWPINKLPASVASRVIEGGKQICSEAGIPLAGGHSIDAPEPIFGLAVSGLVSIENLKRNHTALPGDYIFITKPLGVGMLTTAEKRNRLPEKDKALAANQMVVLNSIGEKLAGIPDVTAMTDVTGFGLGGHLTEMAEGSRTTAKLEWRSVPLITDLAYYVQNQIYPDGTKRNWASYSHKIELANDPEIASAMTILPDPQTNGGILFTVKEKGLDEVKQILQSNGLSAFTKHIGRMEEWSGKAVMVF